LSSRHALRYSGRMSRSDLSTLFAHPLLIGFGHLEESFAETLGRGQGDSFPPYNVEQITPHKLAMTFALAGFRQDDIDIVQDGRHLKLAGKMPDKPDATYLHKGIASRGFRRRFMLADGYHVTAAELRDGLLTLTIERPPEKNQERKIPIKTS